MRYYRGRSLPYHIAYFQLKQALLYNKLSIELKPKLLPILAKSLWLKDTSYNDTWYTNQLYEKACFDKIKEDLYRYVTNKYNNMRYVNQLIEDGKQCAECDVIYEKPHWRKVLCVDCFETKLKNSEEPEFQKASGVEL
jgi:hypothetical protein